MARYDTSFDEGWNRPTDGEAPPAAEADDAEPPPAEPRRGRARWPDTRSVRRWIPWYERGMSGEAPDASERARRHMGGSDSATAMD